MAFGTIKTSFKIWRNGVKSHSLHKLNRKAMTKQEWKTNLRALVAGGAGFVGSHLCRRLLQSGYGEVICVDNLQTGRIANVADMLSAFQVLRA